MLFHIGINLGDVIYDEARIYGDGVNIAAGLESIAEPGAIYVSRRACEQVELWVVVKLSLRLGKPHSRPVTLLSMTLTMPALHPRRDAMSYILRLGFMTVLHSQPQPQ